MTTAEIIYGIVTGLSLVAGFVMEWSRGGDFGARLSAIESQNLGERMASIEAIHDRMRRAV